MGKRTLDANDIGKSITGDPKQLQFNIGDVVFKPFYETYGRHSVYLDVKLKLTGSRLLMGELSNWRASLFYLSNNLVK